MSITSVLRPILFCLPLLAVAACAPKSVSERMETYPHVPLVESGKAEKPLDKALPKQSDKPQSAPNYSAPTPPADGVASLAPMDDFKDTLKLKGLTPVQLRQVLGSPGFQRRDAPAEMWQYRGVGCTLDLYLYDGQGGPAVEHWAVRSPARVADTDCLHQLVEQSHLIRVGS